MTVSFIVSNSGNITVVLKGKPYNVPKTHTHYDYIKPLLHDNEYDNPRLEDELLHLINTGRTIENFSQGRVEVLDGYVYYKGRPLKNAVTDKILQLKEEDFPFEPMVNFLENIMDNPSNQSIEELYDFLAHVGLPITGDGHFLAYKGVTKDLKDQYSRSFDNSPGSVVCIERNQVDDRREHGCSYGLHVGTFNYASSYSNSGTVVLVKVNPADAVSVPRDQGCVKLRVSRYEVLKVYHDTKEIPDSFVNWDVDKEEDWEEEDENIEDSVYTFLGTTYENADTSRDSVEDLYNYNKMNNMKRDELCALARDSFVYRTLDNARRAYRDYTKDEFINSILNGKPLVG